MNGVIYLQENQYCRTNKTLGKSWGEIFKNKTVIAGRFNLDVKQWGPCPLYNQEDEVKEKSWVVLAAVTNSTKCPTT